MIAYSQTYAYDRLGNIDERQEKTCNPTCGPLWNVYDYSYGSKPQAVTSVGGQGSYSYDTNGNMSSRTEGGITYTQIYDVENRLVSVMGGGSSTTFAYDASGQRVKTMATTPSNSRTITYYPFPNYEEEQQQTWYPGVCFATCPGSWMTDVTVKRSLYGLAGQAIATRVVSSPAEGTDGLFYFLGDHLGSTRLLTNTSGTPEPGTTAHFLPYGSYRGGTPVSELTDTGFTGHKHNDSLGLVYMNARFYVPYLNRFISADTIVPDINNPQAHNRYSYTVNNPLKFVDPSGHCWGAFSFVRSWTALGYDTTCNNLDQALNILDNPDANVGQRIVAATYISFEGVAHGGLVVGVMGAACGIVAPCATAVETAMGLACADLDCTNEVQETTYVVRQSVDWLTNQINRVNHIVNPNAGGGNSYRPGHDWSRLINYSGDLSQDYKALQPYLDAVVQYGTQTTTANGQVVYVATVNGVPIEVIGNIVNNVFVITDAWIVIP